MSTKALFPCGEGSNLILGTDMENEIFILRTPAAIKLELMKYQALRPQFFSMGGWGVVGWMLGWQGGGVGGGGVGVVGCVVGW